MASYTQDVSGDEELAWQLQNQLDLEDIMAEQMRMSMFTFGGPEESRNDWRRESRGRGRGKGRGRRGRGRFSWLSTLYFLTIIFLHCQVGGMALSGRKILPVTILQ